jgi:transposase
MNTHQHARMTVHGRALLVNRILVDGGRVAEAAQSAGISERSAYKWLARVGRAACEPFATEARRTSGQRCVSRSRSACRSRLCGARG